MGSLTFVRVLDRQVRLAFAVDYEGGTPRVSGHNLFYINSLQG
jgi:hypothetical protein